MYYNHVCAFLLSDIIMLYKAIHKIDSVEKRQKWENQGGEEEGEKEEKERKKEE